VRAAGIIAIDILEGDDLYAVRLSNGNNEIFVGTQRGMAIRFHESDVRPMGRGAAGVKAISLKPEDTVIEMDVLPETPEGRARAEKKAQMAEEIESDVDSIEVLELVEAAETGDAVETDAIEAIEDEGADAESDETTAVEAIVDNDPYGQILTVTEKGFGKRTPIRAYRLTSRGAQGVSNIRITDKNGKVAGAAHVYAGDQLLLITEQGMMIRVACDDIRSMGRNTQGVRVINIDEGDTVVGAVKVVDREDEKEPLETSETGEEMDAGESSGEGIDEGGGEEGTDEEPVH
jgi:DNA gyrase subunit A